jgi:membrane dipeptidase
MQADVPQVDPTAAQALHAKLLTLDSHIDIPWPNGPDPFTATQRHVDIGKMVQGGLRAGCFAAYVGQGPRTPESWTKARERALAMLEEIRAMGAERNGLRAVLATDAAAIRQAAAEPGVAIIIPAVENGHTIGEDVAVLDQFRALGARYLTLTHNGHNALADSSNPRKDLNDEPTLHGGLSALGREAIAALNRLGMLVDVSHSAKSTMLQAARLSTTPIVATHSCIHSLCPVPRNLDDEQLDVLKEIGGLVQITAVPSFVRPQGKVDAVGVADYMDHLDYAVRRCGIEHVGISSDFDGGGMLSDWRDASQSGNLTAELLRRGYDESEIAALWGGNFLRLLERAEATAA